MRNPFFLYPCQDPAPRVVRVDRRGSIRVPLALRELFLESVNRWVYADLYHADAELLRFAIG